MYLSQEDLEKYKNLEHAYGGGNFYSAGFTQKGKLGPCGLAECFLAYCLLQNIEKAKEIFAKFETEGEKNLLNTRTMADGNLILTFLIEKKLLTRQWLEDLQKFGAEPNSPRKDGKTSFEVALQQLTLENIKKEEDYLYKLILSMIPYLNPAYRDAKGNTYLHLAEHYLFDKVEKDKKDKKDEKDEKDKKDEILKSLHECLKINEHEINYSGQTVNSYIRERKKKSIERNNIMCFVEIITQEGKDTVVKAPPKLIKEEHSHKRRPGQVLRASYGETKTDISSLIYTYEQANKAKQEDKQRRFYPHGCVDGVYLSLFPDGFDFETGTFNTSISVDILTNFSKEEKELFKAKREFTLEQSSQSYSYESLGFVQNNPPLPIDYFYAYLLLGDIEKAKQEAEKIDPELLVNILNFKTGYAGYPILHYIVDEYMRSNQKRSNILELVSYLIDLGASCYVKTQTDPEYNVFEIAGEAEGTVAEDQKAQKELLTSLIQKHQNLSVLPTVTGSELLIKANSGVSNNASSKKAGENLEKIESYADQALPLPSMYLSQEELEKYKNSAYVYGGVDFYSAGFTQRHKLGPCGPAECFLAYCLLQNIEKAKEIFAKFETEGEKNLLNTRTSEIDDNLILTFLIEKKLLTRQWLENLVQKFGADPNSPRKDGKTSFEVALQQLTSENIKKEDDFYKLILAMIPYLNPAYRDAKGNTYLHLAEHYLFDKVEKDKKDEILKSLHERLKINEHEINYSGQTVNSYMRECLSYREKESIKNKNTKNFVEIIIQEGQNIAVKVEVPIKEVRSDKKGPRLGLKSQPNKKNDRIPYLIYTYDQANKAKQEDKKRRFYPLDYHNGVYLSLFPDGFDFETDTFNTSISVDILTNFSKEEKELFKAKREFTLEQSSQSYSYESLGFVQNNPPLPIDYFYAYLLLGDIEKAKQEAEKIDPELLVNILNFKTGYAGYPILHYIVDEYMRSNQKRSNILELVSYLIDLGANCYVKTQTDPEYNVFEIAGEAEGTVAEDQQAQKELLTSLIQKHQNLSVLPTVTGSTAEKFVEVKHGSEDKLKSANGSKQKIDFLTLLEPEEIKSEEIKSEEIKSEEIKSEEIKPEEIKPEEIKPEEIKPEEIKPEEIKPEEIKPEEINGGQNVQNTSQVPIGSNPAQALPLSQPNQGVERPNVGDDQSTNTSLNLKPEPKIIKIEDVKSKLTNIASTEFKKYSEAYLSYVKKHSGIFSSHGKQGQRRAESNLKKWEEQYLEKFTTELKNSNIDNNAPEEQVKTFCLKHLDQLIKLAITNLCRLDIDFKNYSKGNFNRGSHKTFLIAYIRALRTLRNEVGNTKNFSIENIQLKIELEPQKFDFIAAKNGFFACFERRRIIRDLYNQEMKTYSASDFFKQPVLSYKNNKQAQQAQQAQKLNEILNSI